MSRFFGSLRTVKIVFVERFSYRVLSSLIKHNFRLAAVYAVA